MSKLTISSRKSSRRYRLAQDLRVLVPIAKRLARKSGRHGLTVADVELTATNAGFLPAYADRGYRSTLYARVMIAARLERVPNAWRRTPRRKTRGGNLVALWRYREAA